MTFLGGPIKSFTREDLKAARDLVAEGGKIILINDRCLVYYGCLLVMVEGEGTDE